MQLYWLGQLCLLLLCAAVLTAFPNSRCAPQAKDALQLGLVDQMVKPDELMAAGRLALMIAAWCGS